MGEGVGIRELGTVLRVPPSSWQGATTKSWAFFQSLSLNRDVHRHIRVPLSYLGIAGSGRGAADHVGPLTDSVAVGALLLQHLGAMASGTLYLENLSPRWGSVAAAVTGGHVISETSCPVNTRGPSGSFQDSWSWKNQEERASEGADA